MKSGTGGAVSRSPRVLLFVGSLESGGTERQVAAIADGLACRGHDVHVAVLWPGGVHWERLSQAGTAELHPLYARRGRNSAVRALQVFAAPRALRSLIRKLRPDRVHSYLDMANLVAFLALPGAQRPKLVWGMRSAAGQAHWFHAIPFYVCRFLSSSVALAISNSAAGRSFYEGSGYAPERWMVVPNGIDTETFRPRPREGAEVRARWGISTDERVVGVVGRLHPDKGQDVLIEAAARLGEERLRFVIIGGGVGPWKDILLARLQELGLKEVQLVGHERDMAAVYSALDLLCLPSRREGFPNVVAEAMACGVPAVVTRAGDAAEIVEGAGEVVDRLDPEALAAGIRRMLARLDPPLRIAARARIVDRFGKSRLLDVMEETLWSGTGDNGVGLPGRLLFVGGSLRAGGAERVMSTLARHWASEGLPVEVLTVDGAERDFFSLPPAVERTALRLNRPSRSLLQGAWNNFRRARSIRRRIRQARPSVIISFIHITNILTIIATRGLDIPVLVSERTNPERQRLGRVWSLLRPWAYRKADAVVAQSEPVAAWLGRHARGAHVHVIPNPLNPEFHPPDTKPGSRRVVALGRLGPEKGFNLLLESFAAAREKHPNWSLCIYGEGPERERLSEMVDVLGLRGSVRLPGRTDRPAEVLRGAEIFALSSRYEGYPNALMEAMASGLAVVATDCPYGPAELIRDGRSGFLVPLGDSAAMASCLADLMGDSALRNRLGQEATAVRQMYSVERIAAAWSEVIAGVKAGRAGSATS